MDKVLILDFGSQVTQLIARRVRESGVYSEIRPCTATDAEIAAFSPKAVILSGGPASVHAEFAPKCPDIVFTLGVPVLGICYGEQAMCQALGGQGGTRRSPRIPAGRRCEIVDDSALCSTASGKKASIARCG